MLDPQAPLDYVFGILIFSIGAMFLSLILPVPSDKKKPGAPTEDTTKTRRLP
jgi:hypothetical protein